MQTRHKILGAVAGAGLFLTGGLVGVVVSDDSEALESCREALQHGDNALEAYRVVTGLTAEALDAVNTQDVDRLDEINVSLEEVYTGNLEPSTNAYYRTSAECEQE